VIRPDLKERRDSRVEQAALRRIATLVAQGVQPHELFVWGAIVAPDTERLPKTPELVSLSSRRCSRR
jgi:hypothetical protein